jgi:ArsR family transcriptional regulator, arsenate/arsenite/antimonite-responsive transcriptional repressor
MTLVASDVLEQLKALSNEIRYDLVRFLGAGERCVCDLEGLTGLPQSKVSYHLGVLRDAGLVVSEQRGKNVYYALREARLFQLGGQMLTEVFHDPVHLARQDAPLCG